MSFLVTWLVFGVSAVDAEPLPNMPGSKTRRLVFTYMWFAIHESPEDCPESLNTSLGIHQHENGPRALAGFTVAAAIVLSIVYSSYF